MTESLKALGHIGVLLGGCSSERDISFKSGKAVVKALSDLGCIVSAVEIDTEEEAELLSLVKDAKLDVAFLALHGEFGEDGTVQAILEKAGIPYTGSDAKTSRITINKVSTQKVLSHKGIMVPAFVSLEKEQAYSIDKIIRAAGGLPVVVKPACEGSSIGITVVSDQGQLAEAIRVAFGYGPQVLVEQHISGKEITAGILEGQALPLVEIRPKNPFFDFEAKYQKGFTQYIVPAEIPDEARINIQQAALKAYQVLGCRDLSRIDFILDQNNKAYLLEINTIPGFTETSLLPKAARQAGIDFGQLCLRLVRAALSRKGIAQPKGDPFRQHVA